MTMTDEIFDFENEFERQKKILIENGYHILANLTEEQFSKQINVLKSRLKSVPKGKPDIENGYIPFVIVLSSALVPLITQMELIKRETKQGIEKLFPHKIEDFQPIEELKIPQTFAYLLICIERGKEYLNVTPNEAILSITAKKRTPLTIAEGIALLTYYPEFLLKNNCFSLLGSRIANNKRVPAIWLNAKKHPNLGWCWAGNPHTWLGSASALSRDT